MHQEILAVSGALAMARGAMTMMKGVTNPNPGSPKIKETVRRA